MESLFDQTEKIRQKGRRWRKIRNIIFLFLLFAFFCWGGIQYYFPRSKGIVSGELQSVVIKGKIFKTYEGALKQSGLPLSKDGKMLSNEFNFSIAKKSVADELTHTGNKKVELHYTEYFRAIPWRGASRQVVEKIITITE